MITLIHTIIKLPFCSASGWNFLNFLIVSSVPPVRSEDTQAIKISDTFAISAFLKNPATLPYLFHSAINIFICERLDG